MTLSSQPNEAEQEAMLWQARLSSDLITEQQKKEFQSWLAQREGNRLAWQEVNAFWQGLDSLSEADINA